MELGVDSLFHGVDELFLRNHAVSVAVDALDEGVPEDLVLLVVVFGGGRTERLDQRVFRDLEFRSGE